MFKFSRSHLPIGIMIEFDKISLLQVRRVRERLLLENFETVSLQQGLSTWVEKTKTQGKQAVLALSARQAICQQAQFPLTWSEDDIEKDINHNRQHYFPGITEEICFDFSVGQSEDKATQNAVIVATRARHLHEQVHIVTQAGLQLYAVDLDVLGIARVVRFAVHERDIVIIEFLHAECQLIFLSGNNLLRVQRVGENHFQEVQRLLQNGKPQKIVFLGRNNLSEQLQIELLKNLSVEIRQADELKIDTDIPTIAWRHLGLIIRDHRYDEN